MKAAFYTLGCKVNQYESQSMREQLQRAGFEIVPPQEEADIYVVNSCTVTSVSDQKTRQSVRKFKRSHPNAIVALTGCMPQAYPEAAQELTEADIVFSNANNSDLLDLIHLFFSTRRRVLRIARHEKGECFSSSPISGFEERTRAFVKIEDGCNRFCSYCIIPTARGRVRSRPLEDFKEECEKLADAGILELVLVGINLSAYGQDSASTLYDAVQVACETPGVQRVRLGSLEPDHLTPVLLKQLASQEKLCPQFHISLQSGCDRTLKDMNRHYTAAEYESLCRTLREQFADCALTTDVMVGFPGEKEEDFLESLAFVQKIQFEKVHVFPYSPRTGTKAAQRPQLDKRVKEERAHRMIQATEEIRQAFLKSRVGKQETVLFESLHEGSFYMGYTPNYTPVKIKSDMDLRGKLVPVTITGWEPDCCLAE